MKTLVAITCLLAAATGVRGLNQDDVIAKYMEYLMPDLKPCADEYHITEQDATNIQHGQTPVDVKVMGCMKACVMKRMGILTGLDFHLEPIYKMIDVVHAGFDEDIQVVRKIATDCVASFDGEKDECNIGNNYTDCYIEKMFNL